MAELPSSRRPFAGLAIAVACYVAAEIGVSGWLVRYLAAESLVVATGALSSFWFGLSVGRLISGSIADRWEHATFTIWCLLLASVALGAAVLVPWIGAAYALYALAGALYGPVYPMIMAIGGSIYSHRTSALSGGITTAAAVGSVVYPPLMGVMATSLGLRTAMLGAALLGFPAALGILLARAAASAE